MMDIGTASALINIVGWPLACVWMIFEVRFSRYKFDQHVSQFHHRRKSDTENG